MNHPRRKHHRNRKHRHRFAGRLAWGLVLIVMGLAFTLQSFDVLRLESVWRFWPAILIFLGLAKLTRSEERSGGVWLLLIGVWLQISTLELWGLDFQHSWPLLLIAVGVAVVIQSLLEHRADDGRPQPEAPENLPAQENGHAG